MNGKLYNCNCDGNESQPKKHHIHQKGNEEKNIKKMKQDKNNQDHVCPWIKQQRTAWMNCSLDLQFRIMDFFQMRCYFEIKYKYCTSKTVSVFVMCRISSLSVFPNTNHNAVKRQTSTWKPFELIQTKY